MTSITRPTLLLGTDFNFIGFDFENGVIFKAMNSHAVEKLKKIFNDTVLMNFLRDQSVSNVLLHKMKLKIHSPDTQTLRIQIEYETDQQKVYAAEEMLQLICHYIFPPTKGGQNQVTLLHKWRHLIQMAAGPESHPDNKMKYLELTKKSSEEQLLVLKSIHIDPIFNITTYDAFSTMGDEQVHDRSGLARTFRINPAYSLWVEEEEVMMPKRLALAENILDSHLPVKALIGMITSYCSDPPPPRIWRDRNSAIADHTSSSSNSSSSSSSTTISQF